MRCVDVITNFKGSSIRNVTDSVCREVTAHLRNCKYCRSDCETILKQYGLYDDQTIPELWRSARIVIRDLKPVLISHRLFVLLEDRPIWDRLISRLKEARSEFAADPQKFIIDLLQGRSLDSYQRQYWRAGIRASIYIWLFTIIAFLGWYFSLGAQKREGGYGNNLYSQGYITIARPTVWLQNLHSPLQIPQKLKLKSFKLDKGIIEKGEVSLKGSLSGIVVLNISINKDGTVTVLNVERGLGYGLDEEVIRAVSRFKFNPARINGESVDIPAKLEYRFISQ